MMGFWFATGDNVSALRGLGCRRVMAFGPPTPTPGRLAGQDNVPAAILFLVDFSCSREQHRHLPLVFPVELAEFVHQSPFLDHTAEYQIGCQEEPPV